MGNNMLVIQEYIFPSKQLLTLKTSTFKHATRYRLPIHNIYCGDLDNI